MYIQVCVYVCTEESTAINNCPYIHFCFARQAAAALSGEDMYTQSGKLKKKYTRRAGNKNSSAARTAAEAAMQYVGQYVKPSSRKINYEALKV